VQEYDELVETEYEGDDLEQGDDLAP
jgi:hypothetical protein